MKQSLKAHASSTTWGLLCAQESVLVYCHARLVCPCTTRLLFLVSDIHDKLMLCSEHHSQQNNAMFGREAVPETDIFLFKRQDQWNVCECTQLLEWVLVLPTLQHGNNLGIPSPGPITPSGSWVGGYIHKNNDIGCFTCTQRESHSECYSAAIRLNEHHLQ